MVPSSLHAGDDWTSLEGGGPPTPTSKFSVAFHGEGAQGWAGVRSSASSLQPSTPTHLILYHSWMEKFGGREKGRVPQEAGDPSCPPGAPLAGPTRGSSRSTLTFRQPWSSSAAPWLSWPAFLQMDGRDWLQGLSFQRPS